MKGAWKSVLLLACVLALAVWIVGARDKVILPAWMGEGLNDARLFYAAHPAATIALFWAAHFLSAMFSIPGSCTVLNVSSGAVFGFWPGCAIVYPVTMLSGCVGYFAASKLRGLKVMARYEPMLGTLQARLHEGGFLFLVTLRLSPVFPYGALNPLLGLLRVPFGTFFLSTFVGVFLDVFLLNSIGAALGAAGRGGEAYNANKMLLSFCGLLAVFVFVHYLAAKKSRAAKAPE